MSQLGLNFSQALARRSDPDTSHAAADRVSPKVAALELRVVGALRPLSAGLTVPEISDLTGIDKWSVSPRMKPLERKGLVRRLAERRGRATVWVAC